MIDENKRTISKGRIIKMLRKEFFFSYDLCGELAEEILEIFLRTNIELPPIKNDD